MGTILLGNPANAVTSKVTQIAVLEKRYKIIDWIDDMKSNQLGQLHAIWDVSNSLIQSNVLISSTATVNKILQDIVPTAVNMHSRIVEEHALYHSKAENLRNEIATLVEEIRTIAINAAGNTDGESDGVAGVKSDQAQINAMRSQLLKIIQDNAADINELSITFDETSNDSLSVQFTLALNKMDYNDIDQLAHIDRTTDPVEEHQHVDNDDHTGKDTLNHDVTDPIYEFGAPQYTITFKDGDDILREVPGVTGKIVKAPTVSEKEGYAFVGWSIDGENPVEIVTKIGTENVTYIAVWKEAYTITFKNGNKVIGEPITGVTGTSVEAPTVPNEEGYEFAGWSIDGKYQVKPVTQIGTKDITYSIIWKKVYTITFKDGDEILYTITGEKDTPIEIPTEPNKEGYEFVGWSIDTNPVDPVDSVSNKIGEQNITYSIIWKKVYTITFIDGDMIDTVTGETGTPVEAPTMQDIDGFTFAGWADGEHVGEAITKIGTKDITYRAVWKEIELQPVSEPGGIGTLVPVGTGTPEPGGTGTPEPGGTGTPPVQNTD